MKTYNSQPNSPLSANVERISALEYLEAGAKAERNGVDKPAFKHIQDELERLPMARQRLTFEMLQLVWQSLERGEEPGLGAVFGGSYWSAIEPQRSSEYRVWLEKIILRSFELRSRLSNPPGDDGPFGMILSTMLIALGKVDRSRFSAILENLKRRGGEEKLDPRWKVIARVAELFLTLGESEN